MFRPKEQRASARIIKQGLNYANVNVWLQKVTISRKLQTSDCLHVNALPVFDSYSLLRCTVGEKLWFILFSLSTLSNFKRSYLTLSEYKVTRNKSVQVSQNWQSSVSSTKLPNDHSCMSLAAASAECRRDFVHTKHTCRMYKTHNMYCKYHSVHTALAHHINVTEITELFLLGGN